MAPSSSQSRKRVRGGGGSSAGGSSAGGSSAGGPGLAGVGTLAAAPAARTAATAAAVGPAVARARGSSRFRGVSWSNDRGKWTASLDIA